MPSHVAHRLAGVAIMAAAGWLTYHTWQIAHNEGHFLDCSAMFPAFFLMGVGMLFFPLDRVKLQKEHGTNRIERWSQAPFAWKVICVLAIVCGVIDYFVLEKLINEAPIASVLEDQSIAAVFPKVDSLPQDSSASSSAQSASSVAAPSGQSGWKTASVLLGGLLLLVGCIVAFAGLAWTHTMEFLAFFTERFDSDRGRRLLPMGLLMIGVGIGLVWLGL